MEKGKGFTLLNGVRLPLIGLGTYKMEDGKETEKTICTALQSGYRMIDTARIYKNETSIGRGIKKSGVQRDEIILSTKIWNDEKGYDKTLEAVENSLEKLQTDYLDICLIHWPVTEDTEREYYEENIATWEALEKCYKQGKVRAIGVSNFLERHLQELMDHAEVQPMINQLEINPKFQQPEVVRFCEKHGILVEAWSPVMRGMAGTVRLLNYYAQKYKKTPFQISLRWCMQKGILPLPKACVQTHMLENLDIFDFELSDEDMDLIADLDDRLCHAPFDLYDIQQKF